MTLEDARAWLRGERSHTNLIMQLEVDPALRQDTIANIEMADAATTQRAYWIVRAYKEGLMP